jgi:hypothetical protein
MDTPPLVHSKASTPSPRERRPRQPRCPGGRDAPLDQQSHGDPQSFTSPADVSVPPELARRKVSRRALTSGSSRFSLPGQSALAGKHPASRSPSPTETGTESWFGASSWWCRTIAHREKAPHTARANQSQQTCYFPLASGHSSERLAQEGIDVGGQQHAGRWKGLKRSDR